MDRKELLRKFAETFSVPVIYSVDHEIAQVYEGRLDYAEKAVTGVARRMKRMRDNIEIAIVESDLLVARLELEAHERVGVGPANGSAVSEETARKFGRDVGIEEQQLEDFSRWLRQIPQMPSQNFRSAVELLYLMCSGADVPAVFVELMPPNGFSYQFTQIFSGTNDSAMEAWRDRLLEDIEQGKVEDLTGMMNRWFLRSGEFPVFEGNELQSMQVCLAALIHYGGQAAMSGGVPREIVNHHCDRMYHSVVQIADTSEFLWWFKQIALEFADRVKEFRELHTESSVIHRIDREIRGHLAEPLSPTLIAERLEMNTSYLCRVFKKETGKTIGEYINACKIREACRLLRTSDMTLSEISDALAFSSQSYFQRIFKKTTGDTPMSYRQKGKEEYRQSAQKEEENIGEKMEQ